MSKLKTKSSVKKRFSLTASGKVKMGNSLKRHNMRKRTPKANRQARGTTLMKHMDAKNIVLLMPYK